MAKLTPWPGPPTLRPGQVLTRLFVDGVPLNDLQALYDINTRLLGGQRWDSPNRFWSTPPRLGNTELRDVFEVVLTTPKLVNRFSFQLANFPHKAWLQWWDAGDKEWRAVKHHKTKRPIMIETTNSVPARVPDGVVKEVHRHPQHFGAGHWRDIDIRSKAVKSAKFRLVLLRVANKNHPRDRHGKRVEYSLAVQDFQAGFEADHPRNTPRTPATTQVTSATIPFASSTDLLGSPVSFSLRQYRASDILWPSRQALAGVRKRDRSTEGVVWKCEPQPVPYAVVNLYADARDELGDPQTVDRFWIDPLTTGVHCNLYYSNDDPVGDFEASDEELRYPGVQPHGSVTPQEAGLMFPKTSYGYLDIDNRMVQWRTRMKPWWVGLVVQPQFDSTETAERVFIDSPGLRVRWINQTLEIRVNDYLIIRPVDTDFTFRFNDRLSLVVGFDGATGAVVYMPEWVSRIGGTQADEELSGLAPTSFFRLGGYMTEAGDLASGHGDCRIAALVIKQEVLEPEPDVLGFFADPDLYLLKPDIDEERPDLTTNAVLRYHPYYQTPGERSLNPYGMVGGPGNIYENLEWDPINRDYRLHKGYMKFDPVQAKYFKFEFTNLTPEPYTSYAPVSRKVKLFTATTAKESMNVIRAYANTNERVGSSGVAVNQRLGNAVQYTDMNRLFTRTQPDRSYPEYTPTEALYAPDLTAQDRLSEVTPMYNFQPWHRPGWSPRFVRRQRHYYEVVEVQHKSKVAFFVGLRALRMYRLDYQASDDTDCYNFLFYDRLALADAASDANWLTDDPYGLVSPPQLPEGASVLTYSEVLRSQRNILGIQFATSQTPASQVLTDADFNDPTLQYWRPYEGATIARTDDLNTDIGTTIKVSRQPVGSFWNYLEAKYPTWDAIESDATWDQEPDDPLRPTWDDLTTSPAGTQAVGGVEGTELFQPGRRGRLYVAGRAYTPTRLEGLLHLQIVAEDGEVLTDASIEAQPGGVTEWYASYTIGEGGEVTGATWSQVQTLSPPTTTWDDLEARGTWADLDITVANLTGKVFVRMYQDGATTDEFYVDNISLFEDPIVWEFSNDDGDTWWPVYDIRNNPDGVFFFPEVAGEEMGMFEGTNLRWRVYGYRPDLHISSLVIRPWYSSLQSGVPWLDTLEGAGPNYTPYDQYPEIHDHAPFKMWDSPVPEDWWFLYRQWLLQQHPVEVEDIDRIIVPEAIGPVDEGKPPLSEGPYLSDALRYDITP